MFFIIILSLYDSLFNIYSNINTTNINDVDYFHSSYWFVDTPCQRMIKIIDPKSPKLHIATLQRVRKWWSILLNREKYWLAVGHILRVDRNSWNAETLRLELCPKLDNSYLLTTIVKITIIRCKKRFGD